MKQVNEILNVLKTLEPKQQEKVLLECASKVGSEEWKQNVSDLMKRMGMT